ncbi:MAG: class I SAM-dependent methyltransferase [Polyangiales bacterium]
MSRIDRLMFESMMRDDHDMAFERSHDAYWSGDRAHGWFDAFENRFTNSYQKNFPDFVDAIVGCANDSNNRLSHIVEVGTATGDAIAYFSSVLDQSFDYLGLDISDKAVARARDRWERTPCSFETARVQDWVQRSLEPGTMMLAFGGVFEYLRPEQFLIVAEQLRARAPSVLVLLEPIADGTDPSTQDEAVLHGSELTYAHPFVRILSSLGFEMRWKRTADINGTKMLQLIAVRNLD